MFKKPWWLFWTSLVLFICFFAVETVAVQAWEEERPSSFWGNDVLNPMQMSGDDCKNRIAIPDMPIVGPDFPVGVEDNTQWNPDVAYNPNHDEYLVVWENLWGGGNTDIYAARLNGEGDVLLTFAVTFGTNKRLDPSVAYDPDLERYLVAWEYDVNGDFSNLDIWGRFIPWYGPDPSLVEFPISIWTSHQWNPELVYNKNPAWPEFLIVWENVPSIVPSYVSGRRIFSDGSGFPPGDGFTIASDLADIRVSPSVAYNLARNEYLVTYDNSTDIMATRLAANGALLGGGEFTVAGWPDGEYAPSVAACARDDQYFVSWTSWNGSISQIYGRFVTGAGSPSTVHHIGTNVINERNSSLACANEAGHFLVVWESQYSNTSGPYGVWGRLIYPDHSMSTTDFAIISAVAGGYGRYQPAVVAGTSEYFVVWEHQRYGTSFKDIFGAFIWRDLVYLPSILH